MQPDLSPNPFGRDTQSRRSRIRGARGLLGAILLASFLGAAGSVVAGAPEPEPDPDWPSAETTAAGTREIEPPGGESIPTRPVMSTARPLEPVPAAPTRPVLDPSARLLDGSDASEAWTLFIQLESGHRITQRFLLANAGPGRHNGVAVGHLVEPGRAPYRYQNGRRRPRWTLSEDRLFFDIGASHLDLHRPKGELRITKDDIEIRLFFDFAARDVAARIPEDRLPPGYHVEVLAVAAATQGSILAPWMSEPLETRGHAWLVHTWTNEDEADLIARRVEIFARDPNIKIYGLSLRGRGDWESAWMLVADPNDRIIESQINVSDQWVEGAPQVGSKRYPTPGGFDIGPDSKVGPIAVDQDWLRFDPLEVIPQPFRWFIRRVSKPQEVWADSRIGVRLSTTPGSPSLPTTGETLSVQTKEASRSKREIEDKPAERSVTGVTSVTFLNPMSGR